MSAKVPPKAVELAKRVSAKTNEKLYAIYLRAMLREAEDQGVGDKPPKRQRKRPPTATASC